MTVTVEAIKTRFPQFADLDNTTIQANIDDAMLAVDPEMFTDETDVAIMRKAAHYLTAEAFGQPARLQATGVSTIHEEIFNQIRRRKCFGWRLT